MSLNKEGEINFINKDLLGIKKVKNMTYYIRDLSINILILAMVLIGPWGCGNENNADKESSTDSVTAGGGGSNMVRESFLNQNTVLLIDCGSTEDYVDTLGRTWSSDHDWIGDNNTIDYEDAEIEGTPNVRLCQTERWGLSGYSIPIANGTYNVQLHFVENYLDTAGARIMNMDVEGQRLTKFDAFAEAGGKNRLVRKSFDNVAVDDGTLDIELSATQNNTMISCIEVLTGSTDDTMQGKIDSSWELVWSDEFDGSSAELDHSNWDYEYGFVRNNELQYYTDRLDNARVENGNLVIEARPEKYLDGAQYTSACVITKEKHSWAYGRIEMRAKMPWGPGIWAGIWTLGENYDSVGWPACGEIDIMEQVGGYSGGEDYYDLYNGAIHYHDGSTHKWDIGDYQLPAELGNFQDAYHIFWIEWDADKISWFCDGNLFYTFSIADMPYGQFNLPQYILIQLAIGPPGSWAGTPTSANVWPQYFYVDYVRVYQRAS